MVRNSNSQLRTLVSVFRPANSARLLGVRTLGQAGDGLLQTALATFILFSPQREADPRKIALSFAILLVPYSIVGPFAGILIDRWSRRTILIRANILRALTMTGIAIVIAQHHASTLLAFLVLVSLGINRFLQATLATSIPHVVSNDQLVTANALFPTLGTTCASIAAALGIGTQKIFGNTDPVNAGLIVCGIGLALSAAFVGTTIMPARVLGPDGLTGRVRDALANVLSGLIDGSRALRQQPNAIRAIIAVCCQRFAFGILTVHVLLLARNVWNLSSDPDGAVTDFGLAAGSAALGAALAAILSALVLNRDSDLAHGQHKKLTETAAVATAFTIVGAFVGLSSNSRAQVLLTAALISFSGQLLKISADTAIQQRIDDAHRGRVFSLFDMILNVSIVSGICLYALTETLRTNIVPTQIVISLALVGAAISSARTWR